MLKPSIFILDPLKSFHLGTSAAQHEAGQPWVSRVLGWAVLILVFTLLQAKKILGVKSSATLEELDKTEMHENFIKLLTKVNSSSLNFPYKL